MVQREILIPIPLDYPILKDKPDDTGADYYQPWTIKKIPYIYDKFRCEMVFDLKAKCGHVGLSLTINELAFIQMPISVILGLLESKELQFQKDSSGWLCFNCAQH